MGRTQVWHRQAARAAARQAGLLTRSQLAGLGATPSAIRAALDNGRWRAVSAHVIATHNGPLDDLTLLWAVVLDAGPQAAAGPRSTLWLTGVADRPPDPFDVCIPAERRLLRGSLSEGGVAVRLRRRRGLHELRHPASTPARLRIEEAVLDCAAETRSPQKVIDMLLRATQRRLTTAERLRDRLARRRTHPWRTLLADVLADVEDGVQSTLERRWRSDVELAHGLPRAVRNAAEAAPRSTRYRDLRYRAWNLVIELDGREAHPDDERFRDRARDNAATRETTWSLRYGWREIGVDPCGVAAETIEILRREGWQGTPRPCSPACPVR